MSHEEKPVTLSEVDKQQLDTVDDNSVLVSENELTASCLDDSQATSTQDEKLTTSKKKKNIKKDDSIVVNDSESSSKRHEKNSETLPEVAPDKVPDNKQSTGEK